MIGFLQIIEPRWSDPQQLLADEFQTVRRSYFSFFIQCFFVGGQLIKIQIDRF
jgi:hypothetical protein